MYETAITVTGRVVSDITTRMTAAGDKVTSFRLAAQERRYDKKTEDWIDGDRYYIGVSCWRKLADGVATCLSKGDQVVVNGRFRVREYTTEDGQYRSSPEITARAVGPDLARHTVIVNRSSWTTTSPDAAVSSEAQTAAA